MTTTKFHLFAAAMSILAWQPSFADAVATFSYADGTEDVGMWGTAKKENYDIAIKIDDPRFVGAEIVGMRVFVQNNDDVSDYSAWISTELQLENKQNVPDITSQMAERDGNYIDVTFDTPYVLTDAGAYVGYSFKVNSVENMAGKYPMSVAVGVKGNALFMHTSRTYLKWTDCSEQIECFSDMQVFIRGDFSADAVELAGIAEANVKAGEATQAQVNLVNQGVNAINAVGYTCKFNGMEWEGIYEFETPIPAQQGYKATFPLDLPAVDELGVYDIDLAITTVNGNPNNSASSQAVGRYFSLSYLPQANPYMEEFTGTWCGFCPRGFVGMELMNERHPEFIGVAYHQGDPMEIDGDVPENHQGYPSAWMNRTLICDPYFGLLDDGWDLGIDLVWEDMRKDFTPFDITLSATYADEEMSAVVIDASVFTVKEFSGREFRIEYTLVEDGMQGPGSSWKQTNYYSSDHSSSEMEGMEMFINAGSSVSVAYNDVAVANTGCLGVEGSLPESLEADHSYSHSHTFVIEDLYNAAGNPIVLDAAKLRVVATVVENDGSAYGKVINAAKADITGIGGNTPVCADAPVSVKYYDLEGREITSPRGLCLKVTTTSTGRTLTQKIRH